MALHTLFLAERHIHMSNYSVPIDADLWTAWFSAYDAWDSTINFWLTATFAVIIAAHALSSSMTPRLSRLIAGLYGAFCMYTIFRGISVYLQAASIYSNMLGAGIKFSEIGATMDLFADITISLVIVIGSYGTLRFVLSQKKSA